MVKVRLWGEGLEIEELIERICNDFTGVRVLSVSRHYQDRGASVYERVYLDVAMNPKPPEQAEDFDDWLEKHPDAVVQGHSYDDHAGSRQISGGGVAGQRSEPQSSVKERGQKSKSNDVVKERSQSIRRR